MPPTPRARTGANDTSAEVERMLIAELRRMTPAQRVARMLALNRAAARMATARIREQYGPDLPERELQLRLAALRLGRETMLEVFGWDPDVQGW